MWINDYWDLIKILTISDLRIKYQSSVLGFVWSLINPLFMMLILYTVFGVVFGIGDDHFALYILVGIVTWRFFSSGSSSGMMSIATKPDLVKKIFIPRNILVFSSVLSSFISSLLEFVVLCCILIVFRIPLSAMILLFPSIHLLFFLIVYALSLGLSSLYVYYRDLNQIWEVFLQAGFFLCPIVYPLTTIPDKYLPVYMLNPITVIMEIFRDIFLYGTIPPVFQVVYIAGVGIVLLLICRFIFQRLERRFAEEV